MPPIRQPSGILVNGVSVEVKDANADSGPFQEYVRIPGVGSISMPDEAAPQNDIATVDGQVGAAGFAAVGQINVPLGVQNQHASHRFLHKKRIDGESVLARVYKAARLITVINGAGKVAGDDLNIIAVEAALRNRVKNSVRENHVVALLAAALDNFIDYDGKSAAENAGYFRLVRTVSDDGSEIVVDPPFPAAVAAATNLTVRQPGLRYQDLSCQVAQMGGGDFQPASVAAGNLVLRPSGGLPESEVIVALK